MREEKHVIPCFAFVHSYTVFMLLWTGFGKEESGGEVVGIMRILEQVISVI